MEATKQYAVFGAGWEPEFLGLPGRIGQGSLVWRGTSLAQARRKLASARAEVRKIRRQPGNQNASDTYAIYVQADDLNWYPMKDDARIHS